MSREEREMVARWEPTKKLEPDKYASYALEDILPSTRVRTALGGVEATVVRQGPFSTTVDIHRKKTRSFRTSEGEEVSFSKAKERTTWSPGTRVLLVEP